MKLVTTSQITALLEALAEYTDEAFGYMWDEGISMLKNMHKSLSSSVSTLSSEISSLQSTDTTLSNSISDLSTLIGTLPSDATSTTIVDYIQEAIDTAINEAMSGEY